MGKPSPKPPAPPDPTKTASAQTASNKETAYWNAVLNNVNQYTPYGSVEWSQSGNGTYDPNKPPQFTSKINLSPESQQLLDTQMRSDNALAGLGEAQIGRIGQAVSSPYSFGGLPEAYDATARQGASTRAEEALFSRMNPQFQRDEEALRTRLVNQGIGLGSEAYGREMERFDQAKNDARMQAILNATNYGGQLQDQSLRSRNQAIQEYNAQRNAPLNEFVSLTSGQQVQNPQFQSTGYQGTQPVDMAELINQQYQGRLNAYNQQMAGRNSLQSSLFGLGGSALSGFTGSQAGGNMIAGWLS